MTDVEHLFSYGTLRLPEVQRGTFGAELPTRGDALPGYRLGVLTITDPHVIALSGSDEHAQPVPGQRTGDAADSVPGSVLELTPEQLAAADEYEVDDYVRVAVTLASGTRAWVYVAAAER